MAVTRRPPLPSPPPPGGREQEHQSRLPRPHVLPPVLATTSALLLALLAPISALLPVLTTSVLLLALLALLAPWPWPMRRCAS